MPKIKKKITILSVDEEVKQLQLSYIAGRTLAVPPH